ncbi:type IV pilus modification protein PilV [Undibacterium sp. Ji50W]|uniref:type IV pilus modification protein PilV n=1 Tax=Undibacterium sp. Ji50W TaxID=3413041 RepID=UPI003BF54463
MHKRQSGIAMMEVLVTMVIFAIGALGLAAMQITSLKYNKDSAVRSKATLLSLELSDRMRANMTAVKAGQYTRNYGYATASTTIPTAPGCGTNATECTPANMATLDLSDWTNDIARTLPGGAGALIPTANNAAAFSIVVMWKEKALIDANSTDSLCPTPAVVGVRCLSTPFIP